MPDLHRNEVNSRAVDDVARDNCASNISDSFSNTTFLAWNMKATARARITQVFYRGLTISRDCCAFGHARRTVFTTLLMLRDTDPRC